MHEHVHADEDEMLYLLEGELAVFCGQDHWTVTAGSFVFVPRDGPHGFTITSTGPRQGAGDHRPVPPSRPDSGPGRTRATRRP